MTRHPRITGVCTNCGERPGTVRWGDTFALTHGGVTRWCRVCVLTTQIDHAKERREALAGLEAELAAELQRQPEEGSE